MVDEIQHGKRRVRYRGTHPRQFAEKYKELNPERHALELQKVMERGDTPAGTHRPICVREILEILDPRPGEVGLDATLGYGGHAQEILALLLPGGRLFGIDVDPLELPRTEARLRGLGFSEDVLVVRRMNFAGLPRVLPETGGELDFVLADLGVSSMQLDNPGPGLHLQGRRPAGPPPQSQPGKARRGPAAHPHRRGSGEPSGRERRRTVCARHRPRPPRTAHRHNHPACRSRAPRAEDGVPRVNPPAGDAEVLATHLPGPAHRRE